MCIHFEPVLGALLVCCDGLRATQVRLERVITVVTPLLPDLSSTGFADSEHVYRVMALTQLELDKIGFGPCIKALRKVWLLSPISPEHRL